MFGGEEGGRCHSNVNAFNVTTGEIRECQRMIIKRSRCEAALLGDAWAEDTPIVVCGGKSSFQTVALCQIYRPQTDT